MSSVLPVGKLVHRRNASSEPIRVSTATSSYGHGRRTRDGADGVAATVRTATMSVSRENRPEVGGLEEVPDDVVGTPYGRALDRHRAACVRGPQVLKMRSPLRATFAVRTSGPGG